MKKYKKSFVAACIGLVSLAYAPSAFAEVVSDRPYLEYQASTVHRLQIGIEYPPTHAARIEDRGGISHYTVRWGTKQHLPKPKTMTFSGDEPEFVISNLKSGTHYYVDLIAHYNNGDVSWPVGSSDNAVIRDTALDQRLYTLQRRPRFLRVKDKQVDEVTLRWSKKMNNAENTRFRVQVYQKRPKRSGYKKVHDEFIYEADVYKLQVYNLKPGTKHYFVVKGRIFNYEWTNYSDRKYFTTPSE